MKLSKISLSAFVPTSFALFCGVQMVTAQTPSAAQNFSKWELSVQPDFALGQMQIDSSAAVPMLRFSNDSLAFLASITVVKKSQGEVVSLPDKALKAKAIWLGEVAQPEVNTLVARQNSNGSLSSWRMSGNTKQGRLLSCGFVNESENYWFNFKLVSRHPTTIQADLDKACSLFEQNITILKPLKKQGALSPQTRDFSTLKIPAFGVQIQATSDWKEWTNASFAEPTDFAFYNSKTKAKAWVNSAWLGDEFVESGILVDAMLTRWGVDPTAKTTRVNSEIAAGNVHIWRTQAQVGSNCLNSRIFYDGKRVVNASVMTESSCSKQDSSQVDLLKKITYSQEYNRQFTEAQNKLSANVLNQLGMIQLVQDQPFLALSFFDKANKLDSQDPIYLLNCGFVYQLKEMNGPGISHFMNQVELVKQHGKLSWVMGEMYESERNYEQALVWYNRAAAFYPDDEELVINQSDALWGMGQRYASLQVVEQLYKERPSPRLGVYVAKTMMGLEQYAEAIELLQALKKTVKVVPSSLGMALAQALQFQERYADALGALGEVQKSSTKKSEYWSLLGISQYYTRDFKGAARSLGQSLKMDPSQEHLKGIYSAALAFSGVKNNKSLSTQITPVTPLATWESYLDTPSVDLAKNQKAMALQHFYQEALFWQPKQAWRKTETHVIEILNEGGSQQFAEMAWNYIPGWDKISINSVKIYGANHNLKYTGALKDWYVTSESETEGFIGAERAHVPLPNLKVGDFIVVQVSRMSVSKNAAFPFEHFRSSRSIPVAKSQFVLLADTQKILTETYGHLQAKAIAGGIQWTEKSPLVYNREALMPNYRDVASGVIISSQDSWPKVGKDYLQFIKQSFKNSIPVREKAVELRGQLYKSQDIVDVLAGWIKRNIRYTHIPFGGHSIIPAPALEIMTKREGDCKDMALLFKEMLATFNISAELVLVNLDEPVADSLPSIHQFNHMIVHVKKGPQHEERWIDLTEKNNSSRLLPYYLEGRFALLLDSVQSKIERLPTLENSQNHQISVLQKIFVASKGNVDFRDSIVLNGKFAAAFREKLLPLSANDQREFIEGWLAQGGVPAKLVDLKLPNLEDFNEPLTIQTIYSTSLILKNDAVNLNIESPWMTALMKLPRVQNRMYPVRIASPVSLKLKTELNWPEGATFAAQKPEVLNSKIYVQVSHQVQKPSVKKEVAETSWSIEPLYIEPADFADLQGEWQSALNQAKISGVLQLK
jgi:tetratricopeptide (TPR) repeat protein